MQAPKRLAVKAFATNQEVIPAEALIPVFQRWIQQGVMPDELLIDVADYKHVYHGPGIMLIAHEGDYAYQANDGRVGLSYTLKQHGSASLTEALSVALTRLTVAMRLLHQESSLNGLQISGDTLQVSLLDRLRYPHHEETATTVQEALHSYFAQWDGMVRIVPVGTDTRAAVSLEIYTSQSLEHLLAAITS